MSLRIKLTLVVWILFVLMTSALSVFGYSSFKEINSEQSIYFRVQQGKSVVVSVTNFFDKVTSSLSVVSKLNNLLMDNIKNNPPLLEVLEELSIQNGAIKTYVHFSDSDTNLDNFGNYSKCMYFCDLSNSALFEGNGFFVTPVYFDVKLKKYVFNISLPFDENSLVSFVSSVHDARTYSDLIG